MSYVFDAQKGEFAKKEESSKAYALRLKIPKPNTILSGSGAPSEGEGNTGDFYIDLDKWQIYYKRKTWGSPSSLVGKQGESIKGDKGDKGDFVKGDRGDDGVGIKEVNKTESGFSLMLTDGRTMDYQVPTPKDGEDGESGDKGDPGEDGKDGVGISSITQESPGTMVIALTNKKKIKVKLPAGVDGKSIEMGTNETHVRWRYPDGKWNNLFPVPKTRVMAGGGAHYLKDLADVSIKGITNGQIPVWNSSTRKFEPGDAASSTPLPGTVTRSGGYISEIALTGGSTYTITRDGNNRISTIDDGTYTRTFTRGGDGTITSWTIT